MDEGIHVMRKSELRRKKIKFLCFVGLELRASPQKEQQVLKDRSTLYAKYSIKKMVQIFHSQYGGFFGWDLWIKIHKNRNTFGANIPYPEKTVLLLQNSKTKSAHQFQFSAIDFALYRLIFFVLCKIAFCGSILSDTYSMKFCDAFWKMNFSIFNKGEQKKNFSILVQYQWNEIIMHLTGYWYRFQDLKASTVQIFHC